MLLDSAKAVLSVFGFSQSLYEFDKKKAYHWWDEITSSVRGILKQQKPSYGMRVYQLAYSQMKMYLPEKLRHGGDL